MRARRERRAAREAERRELATRRAAGRSLNLDARVDAGGGRRAEAAVTIDAERSVCPRCGGPVDLFDLFGVLELRFDPENSEPDPIAAGGERRTWRAHVCPGPSSSEK